MNYASVAPKKKTVLFRCRYNNTGNKPPIVWNKRHEMRNNSSMSMHNGITFLVTKFQQIHLDGRRSYGNNKLCAISTRGALILVF